MKRRRLWAVIGLAIVATAADAALLCKKKNGVVVLRDATCRKKETAVDPVALGLQGPKGDMGQKGDTGEKGDRGDGGFVTSIVATSESTISGAPANLNTPGPEVSVTVGESGLIEVFAKADMAGSGLGPTARVVLFEDGAPMAGQSSCGGATAILEAMSSILSTLVTAAGRCGVRASDTGAFAGNPGTLVFSTTPGTHTYQLRYTASGGNPATFANRRLSVAAR